MGIWEPNRSLVYGVVIGTMNSTRYIGLINWQAQQSARLLRRTGKITVIVQDNAPIHTSAAVKAQLPIW